MPNLIRYTPYQNTMMEEWKVRELAKLLKLAGQENRIALLYGIEKGKKPLEIVEERDISRQTLQGHIDKLRNGGLVEKEEKGETPYRLTNLGSKLLPKIKEIVDGVIMKSRSEEYEEMSKEALENLKEVRKAMESGMDFDSPFSKEDLEKLIEGDKNKR